MTSPKDMSHIEWDTILAYDETSPSCLRWKVNIYSGKRKDFLMAANGDVAGCFHKGIKYWVVRYDNRKWLAHRVVWCLLKGLIEVGDRIDHKDGDTSNNTIENLRKVPTAINTRNQAVRCDNVSGITGVSFDEKQNRVVARWQKDNKSCSKSFSTMKYGYEEAFRLACEYRKKMIEELNAQGAGYTERHGT